jgi:hypothetical protein
VRYDEPLGQDDPGEKLARGDVTDGVVRIGSTERPVQPQNAAVADYLQDLQAVGFGWARMWDQGVGGLIRRRQAWLATARDDLTAALRGSGSGGQEA